MNMIKLALLRALWPKFGYQGNPEVLNESLIKRQQNHKLAPWVIISLLLVRLFFFLNNPDIVPPHLSS